MQVYLVGGAVRDTLLGLPVKDRDWVVVGATVQQLLNQGFLPVGRDFPVFLHPVTREQYALARTERKTAPGYHGFATRAAPDVTLEQDLARRDLTINAMAVATEWVRPDGSFDPVTAVLADPFHGRRDLLHKLLRHASDAFHEDPVRILRVARFAARLADFTVAPDTMDVMRRMVADGEITALVSERVWQELAAGLMENAPTRMFDVMRACGALALLLPEVDQQWNDSDENTPAPSSAASSPSFAARMLEEAACGHASLPLRFACLCLHIENDSAPQSGRAIQRLCARLRVPTDCCELALVAARERTHIDTCALLDANALVRLLERCDAFRKPARFAALLLACEYDAHARQPSAGTYVQRPWLLKVLAAARTVATDAVAAQARGLRGAEVGAMVRAVRASAVAAIMRT